MSENTKDYSKITIDFTIEEMVTLLSCCNQAIINIENVKRDGTPDALRPMHNGVTLQGSLDKIWEVKTKLKKSITASLSQSIKNNIPVTMDITDYVKLNGCCNAAIEMEEKTINFLPPTSDCIKVCNETIQKIMDIKYKIKSKLNILYGNTLFS